METYRIILIAVIMALSLTDLIMTGIYVNRYKKWQPEKPYKLIELNPLLVFLWNNFGFAVGMVLGGIILLSLNYLIAKNTYWLIPAIIGVVLILNILNHFKNFGLLASLMEKYPLGHLPEQIFGSVVGNK